MSYWKAGGGKASARGRRFMEGWGVGQFEKGHTLGGYSPKGFGTSMYGLKPVPIKLTDYRDMGAPVGRIMPSLQDGGAFWDACSPGFTRGYFHSLPLGARNGEDGVWGVRLHMNPMFSRARDIHPTDEDLSEGTSDMGHAVGRIMPSLQDGGAFWDAHSPGFTRGYFHSLPLGARNGGDGDCAIPSSIESHVPECEGHPPHGRRPVRGDPGHGAPGHLRRR